MSPVTSKSNLRRQYLQQRRALSGDEWQYKSQQICHHLRSSPWFQAATTILAYFSIRQEPDLVSLITAYPDRRWGFSRCLGDDLIWHTWSPGEPLVTGLHGIAEPLPTAHRLTPNEVDLILVPAVACDRRGYRLGYGGGYYDRLLSDPDWSLPPTIGLVFDFAWVPNLPIDPWDRPLNAICTESTFWSISQPRGNSPARIGTDTLTQRYRP